MKKLLTVLPVIDWDFAYRCIETTLELGGASGIRPNELLVVDNSNHEISESLYNSIVCYKEKFGFDLYRDPNGHNLGTSRAWNIGARKVLENKDIEYLVIMSSAMRFGPELHTTWRKQMETFWGANCIECDGHSWHLIAFHRRIFELVGLFDENFYPGYFEAIDFGYRLRMLNMEGGWPRVWVNALSASVGRHTDLVLAPPLLDYYREKWGGDKGEEKYVLPWGDKPLGYYPENSIPELAKKYNLTNWW